MTMTAADLANLFLSLAALAGILILRAVITARDRRAPLNRRFLFGLNVLSMLFGARFLLVVTGLDPFRLFILLAASLIPLAVLLLAEGLLRRHAPAWAKLWVGAGTVLFALSSLWWSDSIDPARLIGLLVFQLSGFLIAGWLVLTRDRASLSAAENRMVERLALSLVLLIPLAAADFLMVSLGLPAQISSLGVLFLCWLAVSLSRAQVSHRAPLVAFVAVVAGGVLSGGVVARMAGLDKDMTILSLAVILSAVLVAVLFVDAQTLRADQRSQSLLRYLADDRSSDGLQFLRGLQAHPLVDGAALVSEAQLEHCDRVVLRRIFARAPVLRRSDPPFTDGAEGDHIAHLFRLFDASHILIADHAPLTLVALSMPSLAASPRAELELAVVQRMARLMSVKTTEQSVDKR